MSWQPFVGRVLSPNHRSPVSPNVETKRRNRPLVEPFKVIAVWSLTGSFSGHATTIPSRQDYVPLSSFPTFEKPLVTNQGDSCFIRVIWNISSGPIFAQVFVNYGSGYVKVAEATDLVYPGGQPYDTGDLPWDAGTGSVNLNLSGNSDV